MKKKINEKRFNDFFHLVGKCLSTYLVLTFGKKIKNKIVLKKNQIVYFL